MSKFTPQQKQLETIYRGKSAKRAPTLKQKSLSRAYNKPSVTTVQKAKGAKVSPSVIAKSKLRQLKTSTAKSISKFGGGVKAKLGGTLAATKALAVKQGARGLTLGKLAANSKFLAGINSFPGLALVVGNVAVWKSNIRQLKAIYNQRELPPILCLTQLEILLKLQPNIQAR